MSRDTSASFNTAADSNVLYPALLAELEFSSGFTRMWSGYGDLVYDSNTYTGIGTLAGVSSVVEGADVSAGGITMTLNGIPPTFIALALADSRQGTQVRFHLALFDASGSIIDTAEDVFRGLMDVPTILKSQPTSSITITAESRLIELQKAKERRYTHEDQQELYPGDKGLEYVAGLQGKKINWGTADREGG